VATGGARGGEVVARGPGAARWWGGAAGSGGGALLRMAAAAAGRRGPPNDGPAAPPLRRHSSALVFEKMSLSRAVARAGEEDGYLYPRIFSPGSCHRPGLKSL
jgi:hypothetical protein